MKKTVKKHLEVIEKKDVLGLGKKLKIATRKIVIGTIGVAIPLVPFVANGCSKP